MKQINLCLSQLQQHGWLGEELTSLGYQVVADRNDIDEFCEQVSIVDSYFLEKYPSRFTYPILFSEEVAEDTMQTVDLYSCIGVIDRSCRGYLLKSVVEVCLARKKEREKLLKENQKLSNKLLDRRIIEKAKFVLMKRLRTSEEEAYRRMRTKAMREQKSLKEIADIILLHEE